MPPSEPRSGLRRKWLLYLHRIICLERGDKKRGVFARITGFLTMQFKVTASLVKLSRNFPVVFFYIGEFRNPLALLTAKLLGKKTIIQHKGGDKFLEARLDAVSFWEKVLLPWLPRILIPINYFLADVIVCESKSIVSFGRLDKYRHKIISLPGRYVDTQRFHVKKQLSQRSKLAGFIGRLTPKKGIVNLVKSMPLVLEECSDVEFLLVGRGVIRDRIREEVERNGVEGKVNFVDWVSDDELPAYLNRLRLFVSPSFEEGVPGILQEAMACGTIVAATPVGGIPDLVRDKETGFVINDNTPEGIAKTIIKALNYARLDEVAKNARALIEKEYSYDKVVEEYRDRLEGMFLNED
ncbi:D-inositol-3-phosphate glycosyltransferase [subsurface metagenome]